MEIKTKRITGKTLREQNLDDFKVHKVNAEGGNPISQFNLALCHLYGQHTEVDYAEAYKWFEKAALQGDTLSGLFVGYLYEVGLGRCCNYTQALLYYAQYSSTMDLEIDNLLWERVKKMDESEIQKHLEQLYSESVKQVERILRIDNFGVYNPLSNSFSFNWTETTRNMLRTELKSFNKRVKEFRIYLDAYTSDSDDDRYGYWMYLYEDTLALPFEVFNGLVGRDALFSYLKGSYDNITPRPQFDYALGRCLLDDNDSTDNDYIISGLLLMAGHDESPLWQNRVGLWYEYRTENKDLLLAEQWYERAINQGFKQASINLQRLKEKREYRLSINNNEGTAIERLEIAKTIKGNEELRNKWILAAALNGNLQAHDLLAISLNASGNSLYGKNSSFTPSWKLYDSEQTSCQTNSLKWKEKEEKKFRESEEEKECKRREAEEAARRRKEKEEMERKKAEEAARRRKEDEERRRLLAEEREKRRAELKEKRNQQWAIFKQNISNKWQAFKEKAIRFLKILLLVILIGGLIGGGVYLFFYLKDKNKEDVKTENVVDDEEDNNDERTEAIDNIDEQIELKKEQIEKGLTKIMKNEMKHYSIDYHYEVCMREDFSREFISLYDRVKELEQYDDSEIGFWDTDLWGAQDNSITEFQILDVVNIRDDRATAVLKLQFGQRENGYIATPTIELVFEGGKWVIDDNGYKEGMKSYIEAKETDDIEEEKTEDKSYSLNLSGVIDRYNIIMTLNIEDKLVTGSYYYTNSGTGSPLQLTGVLSEDGHLKLNETNEEGMPTGHFKGVINAGIYQGTFVNFKGESMDFYVSVPDIN